MRWPVEWRDPGALDLVKGTPLGCLLFPSPQGLQSVIDRARQQGITVCESGNLPPGVEMVKGEWPGIRLTSGGGGDASSGPTGKPWIDSNGWLLRLTRTQKPDRPVWVTADPPKANEILPPSRHLVAVADASAHAGRWVVSLDKGMADGLAAGNVRFLEQWKKLMLAIRFFEEHDDWNRWPVSAVLAVVSDFSGGNEFLSHEVLNLMARTEVSYCILQKEAFKPEMLRGLRAVLYPDSSPPSAELRRAVLDFVERGGLLIAGPRWGKIPGAPAPEASHPRYSVLQFGKGRIAMALKDPDDPYVVAGDAQILLSHRYDQVRFFNGFALGSHFTLAPDGKRALVHVVNYAGDAARDPVTMRVAGSFRSAKLWSFDPAAGTPLEMSAQIGAVEVHLPRLAVYGAVELEA